jgi:hypothetical protein
MLDFSAVTGKIVAFANGLSADQAFAALEPLTIFVVGMIIYAVFIFKFYRFIGSRNVFKPISKSATPGKKFLHGMDYVFFYPLIAFAWFIIMSILLAILSETVTITNLFIASMATIVTVRIVSYYSEELSREIAKLVPLALLGLMLLDISRITIQAPLTVLSQIQTSANTLFYYFIFLVTIEFALRLLYFVRRNDAPLVDLAPAQPRK